MALNSGMGPHVRKEGLKSFFDQLKVYMANKITKSIGDLGTVFALGDTSRVDTKENLPAEADVGTVILVGLEGAEYFEEYYRTPSNTWELMGTTKVSLDGLTTDAALFAGPDGTGTVENPAAGTILADIYDQIDNLQTQIDNITNETTGILAQAKTYVDSLKTQIDARLDAIEADLNSNMSTEEIQAMFTESDAPAPAPEGT